MREVDRLVSATAFFEGLDRRRDDGGRLGRALLSGKAPSARVRSRVGQRVILAKGRGGPLYAGSGRTDRKAAPFV